MKTQTRQESAKKKKKYLERVPSIYLDSRCGKPPREWRHSQEECLPHLQSSTLVFLGSTTCLKLAGISHELDPGGVSKIKFSAGSARRHFKGLARGRLIYLTSPAR